MKRDDCATYINNKKYFFTEKNLLANKYIYELINLIEVAVSER